VAGLHAAWLLAWIGALPGCFTHPINRAPNVMPPMRTTTDTVIRGQDVTFRVDVNDPDQDHVDITWAVKSGPCPDRNLPANWPTDASPSTDPSPFTFTVSGDQTNTRFCVWALATDEHGATGANNQMVDPSNPGNQPPIAHIELVDPAFSATYPLYTKFKLVGSGEDPDGDRDPIQQYNWLPLQVPPGSDAVLGACDDGATDKTVQCFTANTPGSYTAALKVSSQAPFQTSPDESVLADMKTFVVMPDAPPCISVTRPAVTAMPVPRDPSDRTFEVVQVDDDGDEFPPTLAHPETVTFTWSYGLKGNPLAVVDGIHSPRLIVPMYNELDVSVVRVEVLDRRPNALASLQMCDTDFCEANPGSGCFQRVTWTVTWR
jgi:hypothetical protein